MDKKREEHLFGMSMIDSSPSNGQNIVELLSQSAKKWLPQRESFHCLVRELDGPIEVAVSRSTKRNDEGIECCVVCMMILE